jgi:hypothetical protein
MSAIIQKKERERESWREEGEKEGRRRDYGHEFAMVTTWS